MNLTDAERRAFEREQRAQAAADRDYGCALWYAWGRIDSGQYRDSGITLDAFKFAESHKANALLFHRQERHSLESIQDAWSRYVEAQSS